MQHTVWHEYMATNMTHLTAGHYDDIGGLPVLTATEVTNEIVNIEKGGRQNKLG